MNGFERASREYERRLTSPYDVGGALYEEEDDDDDAYWHQVDSQIEDYKMGD